MSKNTKVEILNAAESLFAKHGFVNTSMRMITQLAKVNLASVNYHFGSKKNLIQAVLKRHFDVIIPNIDNNLDVWIRAEELDALTLIESIALPLLDSEYNQANSTALFVQVLGRGYSETQGHLRRFITQQYGCTIDKMLEAFHMLLPNTGREEVFWRLHFALGSFVFSLSSYQALSEIAVADFNQVPDVESMIKRLITFVAAGVNS
jgi:AcrR family transcriptional regulator